MALPTQHSLIENTIWCSTVDVTTGKTGASRLPFRGKLIKVGSTIGSAISTADATVTVSIAGTAVTGGAYTLTQSGSAAGNVFTALPTAANTGNEDDSVTFAVTGSGTAGGHAMHFAVVQKIGP
jgi:hypothetical protein